MKCLLLTASSSPPQSGLGPAPLVLARSFVPTLGEARSVGSGAALLGDMVIDPVAVAVLHRLIGEWTEQQCRSAKAQLAMRRQNEDLSRSISQQRAELAGERQGFESERTELEALRVDVAARELQLLASRRNSWTRDKAHTTHAIYVGYMSKLKKQYRQLN